MSLSDRIALFNLGRIEQVGSPETLYRAPETLFTARFLGDSTVFELDSAPGGTVGWAGRTWSVATGTVSDRARTGGAVALVVRPEDVHIAASEDAVPPGASAVAATVTDVQYLGSYRSVLLALDGGVVGRARVDASETVLAPGEPVVAWWRVERQRVVSR